MSTELWFVAAWLACGVLGYGMFRWTGAREGCRWTVGDRAIALALLVLLGPIFAILGMACWLGTLDWDKPAKW